ncbi:helicase protein [Cooperia oncophora]
MRNYVLRREKSFLSPLSEKPLVELPEKHSHEHMLQFSESERKAYDLMYEASRAKVREMMTEEEVDERFGVRTKKKVNAPLTNKNVFLGAAANSNPNSKFGKMGCMLVILLRLRQACIHFSLTKNAVDMEAFQSIDSENPLTSEEQENLANLTIDSYLDSKTMDDITYIFRRKFVSAKIQLALDLLKHILEDGEKCVIVSQWTSFLKILEKHIKKRFPDIADCSTISGEVLPLERQDRVNSFNENGSGVNVMLISITAGGVGLNLTGGNHLILMDLHWNPALELQARDRVHRMGQTKEVHLHKIIMKGSIEERVLELQMKKMELANNVLKGAVSKKNMNLTMADLKFLFDLDGKK